MQKKETLRRIGELELIKRITRLLPARPDVTLGAGDDCAVVRMPYGKKLDLLLTSDAVIEGVHFTPNAPQHLVGRKALGRALSDIAAMGGTALWAVVDLVAPGRIRYETIAKIYEGMRRLARRFRVAVVGGDTAEGQRLELHVFAAGAVPRGRAILRSGAGAGDSIYATGVFGGSASGRHLHFMPRLEEGEWLMRGGWTTAMIDVSDGIASDLRRLMEASGTGAVLFADRIPIAEAVRRMRDGVSPLEHALADGEDFELLFTVAPDKTRRFEKCWQRRWRLRCSKIGEMTGNACVLELARDNGKRELWYGTGYQHFNERKTRRLERP